MFGYIHKSFCFLIFRLTFSFVASSGFLVLNSAHASEPKFDANNLIGDMSLEHDAAPSGVPRNFSWAKHPVIQAGAKLPAGFSSATAWGQIYEASGVPSLRSGSVKIQFDNLRMYGLNSRGAWICLQEAREFGGGLFFADYGENKHARVDLLKEDSGGMSVEFEEPYHLHFWPRSRIRINADYVQLAVVAKARYVAMGGNSQKSSLEHRYLFSVGADYWKDQTADWDGYKSNKGIGIGRFKFISADWQWFTMTTMLGVNSQVLARGLKSVIDSGADVCPSKN